MAFAFTLVAALCAVVTGHARSSGATIAGGAPAMPNGTSTSGVGVVPACAAVPEAGMCFGAAVNGNIHGAGVPTCGTEHECPQTHYACGTVCLTFSLLDAPLFCLFSWL